MSVDINASHGLLQARIGAPNLACLTCPNPGGKVASPMAAVNVKPIYRPTELTAITPAPRLRAMDLPHLSAEARLNE